MYSPSAVNYQIGSIDNSTFLGKGKYYYVDIRNGIGGESLMPQPIEAWRRIGTSGFAGSFIGTQTIYIYNGAVAGYDIDDVTANLTRILPILLSPVIFVAIGHNDNQSLDATYIAKWDAFLDAIKLRATAPQIIMTTENPEYSPATYAFEMSIRRRELLAVAAKNNAAIVDTYGAFISDIASGNHTSSNLVTASDGVHPTTIGQSLLLDTIYAAIK